MMGGYGFGMMGMMVGFGLQLIGNWNRSLLCSETSITK